jgi:hypothetical protein
MADRSLRDIGRHPCSLIEVGTERLGDLAAVVSILPNPGRSDRARHERARDAGRRHRSEAQVRTRKALASERFGA